MRMAQFTVTLSLIYRLLILQEGIEAKQMQICEKMLNSTGEMEDRINEKLDREFNNINVQLSGMREILGQILVQLEMPNVTLGTTAATTTMAETTTALECLQDTDAFEYDGKCFWMIIDYSGVKTQSYDLTRSWCQKRGGDIGNVYSEEHYELVEQAARSKLEGSSVYFWTNMTYESGEVFLENKEKAPYIRWYSSSYPTSSSGSNGIKIQYNSDPDDEDHGYYNRGRYEDSRGVLCQSIN